MVGLGPGGPELLTAATTAALERFRDNRWVRTTRHPAADAFAWTGSFDDVYEGATSLEDVYATIVERLVALGDVLYAVPGSPVVAERTVELLRADGRVSVDVLPALSFVDLAWTRLGVDPVEVGVRVVDGHRFAVEAAGERGPLLVAQCDTVDVLSEVKLAFGDDAPRTVTVLQRLGLPDEAVFDVAGEDLDRSFVPDHLTSLWIPTLAAPVGAELVRFAELVRTLRSGCPWDREQTHHTLTRHLVEETYEVLEAIEGLPGSYAHLEEELGDLLFQVVFHAVIGAEQGEFTLADVARGIHDKLVRRHPHVFGGEPVPWEELKRQEKGRASVMEGVPRNLPALLYAYKVLGKAQSAGFDGDVSAATAAGGGLGEELLALVRRAREEGEDPETALRVAAGRLRDAVLEWERARG